jgi:hypothetical protein
MNPKAPVIKKITKDMVGLEFTIDPNMPVLLDFNSYRLRIKFEELSEEGLELFGVKEK